MYVFVNITVLSKLTSIQKWDLADVDDTSTLSTAELSRAKRVYKEEAKGAVKQTGRKRQKLYKAATYTNWFEPFLWEMILLAVKKAGRPWKAAAIVAEAKKISPHFDKLTTQVWYLGQQNLLKIAYTHGPVSVEYQVKRACV